MRNTIIAVLFSLSCQAVFGQVASYQQATRLKMEDIRRDFLRIPSNTVVKIDFRFVTKIKPISKGLYEAYVSDAEFRPADPDWDRPWEWLYIQFDDAGHAFVARAERDTKMYVKGKGPMPGRRFVYGRVFTADLENEYGKRSKAAGLRLIGMMETRVTTGGRSVYKYTW